MPFDRSIYCDILSIDCPFSSRITTLLFFFTTHFDCTQTTAPAICEWNQHRPIWLKQNQWHILKPPTLRKNPYIECINIVMLEKKKKIIFNVNYILNSIWKKNILNSLQSKTINRENQTNSIVLHPFRKINKQWNSINILHNSSDSHWLFEILNKKKHIQMNWWNSIREANILYPHRQFTMNFCFQNILHEEFLLVEKKQKNVDKNHKFDLNYWTKYVTTNSWIIFDGQWALCNPQF